MARGGRRISFVRECQLFDRESNVSLIGKMEGGMAETARKEEKRGRTIQDRETIRPKTSKVREKKIFAFQHLF